MDLFSSLVRAGGTVLDVGANLGGLTLGFAGLVGATGRGHAFDPHAQTSGMLCANVRCTLAPVCQCTSVCQCTRCMPPMYKMLAANLEIDNAPLGVLRPHSAPTPAYVHEYLYCLYVEFPAT